MKALEDYIAFDLEFNQYEGAYQIIQVSAVRFTDGKVDHYDSYVYTDKPLKAFINGLTALPRTRSKCPQLEQVSANSRPSLETGLDRIQCPKERPPILLENGLDLKTGTLSMSLTRGFERRPSDLHGIKKSPPTPLQNFWSCRKIPDSLEDARMTALVYEQFLEFDQAVPLLEERELLHQPFGGLDLSGFFDE